MINSSKQIFVNRTLNMNIIKMIGFDMDYTLVTYNVPAFEAKAYSIMQEKLIKNYGYPEEIRKFEFDKDFVIRGLVIDTESGNFMKVNRYGYVRSASHGTRFMTFEEQKEKFGLYCIDLTDPRYSIAHTLFSKAEGCLFAQLVDFFDEKQENPNYKKIFSEISVCLNEAHQETELKGDVVNNPEKYIIPNIFEVINFTDGTFLTEYDWIGILLSMMIMFIIPYFTLKKEKINLLKFDNEKTKSYKNIYVSLVTLLIGLFLIEYSAIVEYNIVAPFMAVYVLCILTKLFNIYGIFLFSVPFGLY